jgi:acetyltransferase
LSTRYLQNIVRPRAIIVWQASQMLTQEATRWRSWFDTTPPSASVHHITNDLPLYQSEVHSQSPILFIIATPDHMVDCCRIACVNQWPLIVLPKLTLARTAKHVRTALADLKYEFTSRIIGPDTGAFVLPHHGLQTPNPAWPQVQLPNVKAGHIAVLAQSPSITACIRDWVSGRQIGLSHLICVGGSSDVNIADLVDTLIQDPHCRALVIQIDRLRLPARFISALRSCTRQKPVMVLHTGRVRDFQTEQDPEDETFLDRELLYQAAITRSGASTLNTLDDLFQGLESLTKRRVHDGHRLMILGSGDGLEALAADHLYEAFEGHAQFTIRKEPRWFESPEDFPLDPETLAEIRSETDGVLIPIVAEHLVLDGDSHYGAWASKFAAFEQALNRPLYLAAPGMVLGRTLRDALDRVGLAAYATPEQALNGFLSLARHQHASRLVDAHVDSNDLDALVSAEQALKAHLPGVKTLDTQERKDLQVLIPGFESKGSLQGVMQRLAAGIARDPIFGPVIYVHEPPGHFPKLAVTLPPINQALGEDLLHRSATGRALKSTDPEGFAKAALLIVNCSRLLSRVPEIASLKIQLSVARGHVQASLNELCLAERVIPAITPYPESLDRPVILKDGRVARLRPLRPEDEDAHRVFLSKLSRATLRFRYFSDKQGFSARELAAMTHVDYSREVALIVSAPSVEDMETLGVVRVIFDADGLAAEFAMVVRDDLQRSGVGKILLQAAVDLARDRDARLIYGETMIQNKGMQGLAKTIGFQVKIDFDAECVWMRMPLAAPRDSWEESRLETLAV